MNAKAQTATGTDRKVGRPIAARTLTRFTGLIKHLDKKYQGQTFTTHDLFKSFGIVFRGTTKAANPANTIVCQLNRMVNQLELDAIDRLATGKRGNRLLAYKWDDKAKRKAVNRLLDMGGTWTETETV